jgi:hypothetical protein
MDHPEIMVDNQAFKVSANTPAILEKYQFGFLFNSRMEGNSLKTEAWIDTNRAAHLNDNTRWVMGRLASMSPGDSLEVSTGLFTGAEFHTGKWEGKDYTAVWSGVVPDHLAFLPEGALGACSVKDGCGAGYQTLRANCNGAECDCGSEVRMAQSNKPTDEQDEEDETTEASGETSKVNKKKDGEDGEDGEGEDKEDKKDAAAKSKIAQPAVLKAMQSIKSKIDGLFRTQAGASFPDGAGVGSNPNDPGLASLKPPLEPPEATSDFFMRMVSEPYEPAPQDVGPAEKRDMTTTGNDSDYNAGSMTSFLDEIEEGEDTEQNIERDPTDKTKPKKGTAEMFPSRKLGTKDISEFEAALLPPIPPIPPITETDEAHSFTGLFDNAAVEADQLETNAMNAQEARKFLANFGHTEAALKSMEDPKVLELARGVAKTINDHLKKVGAGQKAKKRQGSMMDEDNTDIDGNPDDDMTGKSAGGGKGEQDPPLASLRRNQATLEDLLAQASPNLRESIESGVRLHEARKDQLIHSLLKTNRCQFKANELKRFSIDFLENLAALAAVPQDYSGLNVNRQPRLQRRESTGFAPKPPGLLVLKGGKNGKNGNGNGNGNGKRKPSAAEEEAEGEDDFPHTYAKSAYEAGGPGYDGNSDGEGEGDYDGTGADSDGVDVKKTKKRAMTSD